MADLTSKRVIVAKGFLFLLAGLLSAGLLIADLPTARTIGLLTLTVWCSCRFYYFAFYVIQHYVDDQYRFAGLCSFFRYMLKSSRAQEQRPPQL